MPLNTGQILNSRYRIVKLLGQGGFGAVYKAWDLNFNLPCAVKENLDTTASSQRQFEREARMLRTLHHSNLPQVIDHFILPGQGQYLVMDFIEGEDLQSMLDRQGGLPEGKVLNWIDEVCDALNYMHSQNPPIIHRDIKPANIKIGPQGQATLVDFGIAKVFDAALKTTLGAQAVTPGYSPPEQYGQGVTDRRSDIYALGATMYACLTGQQPIESVQRIMGKPFTTPRLLKPAISPEAEAIILKSMETQPEARFQTAAELSSAISTAHPPDQPAEETMAASPNEPTQVVAVMPTPAGQPYTAGPSPSATIASAPPVEAKAPPSAFPWKIILIILVVVVLLAAGGIGGYAMLGRPGNTATPTLTEKPTKEIAVLPSEVLPATDTPIPESTLVPVGLQTGVPVSTGLIDDFDTTSRTWAATWQDGTQTTITCARTQDNAHSGNQALQIDFNVQPNSWATCELNLDENQDWSAAGGLSFAIQASDPGLMVEMLLFGGDPGARVPYSYKLEITPEMVNHWVIVELGWDKFVQPEYEANPGTPIDPSRVNGLAFTFNTNIDTPSIGKIWVDDILLTGLASPGAAATFTPLPAATGTPLPEPTPIPTATSAAAAPPVIGGADKIAYINNNDVWMANLDGSELTQLTKDGAAKTYLRWTPDGQALTYISGKCVQKVDINQAIPQAVTCFNNSENLEGFEISPDGKWVALSLDHLLYILPMDFAALSQVNNHDGLKAMAGCSAFAPYQRNLVRYARWSSDSQTVATVAMIPLPDGRRGDVVTVFSVDRCIPDPPYQDIFPGPSRFEIKTYNKNPVIQTLGWDGLDLFALTGYTRNDGYGDLYIYNMSTHKADKEVNPIKNVCCYRDPQFSPDGNYLVFAFQNYYGGANSTTQLYMIRFGDLESGTQFTPLPLPDITNPLEKPQPVLRPVQK
jgi:serine/threonine protein kinase